MSEARDEGVEATVVSHKWVELGRDAKLALAIVYDVGGTPHDGLLWFTDAARNMGSRGLRSLGFDITARDPAELDDKPELLKGAKCRVKLTQQSYNGRMETKADLVIPRDVAVGRGSLKALGERIRNPTPPAAKAKSEVYDDPIPPTSAPTNPPAQRTTHDPGINFDDIPFGFLLTTLALGASMIA